MCRLCRYKPERASHVFSNLHLTKRTRILCNKKHPRDRAVLRFTGVTLYRLTNTDNSVILISARGRGGTPEKGALPVSVTEIIALFTLVIAAIAFGVDPGRNIKK